MDEFTPITKDRGLYKKILREGQGNYPLKTSKIILDYRINNEDGTLLYEKVDKILNLDDQKLIDGLILGIISMKKGEKAILVMRYDYGYGETNHNNIKAYSSIMACIELKEILS